MRNRSRTPKSGLLAALLCAITSGALLAEPIPSAQPFLEEHCLRCHGEKKVKGDLRLDTLPRDFENPLTASHWADVMERISSGEMPPEDEPQPSAENATRAVEWIAAKLKEGETARLSKRERMTFHKLTREEYANTIYDLLGVRFDPADPTGLPEDPNWHGFERIGSVLSLSPSHVEKHLAAAEAVLNEALPAAPPKQLSLHWGWRDLRGGSQEKAKELGIEDKVRVEVWPGSSFQGGEPNPRTVQFPATGNYRLRMKLSGMKPPKGRAPRVTVYAMDLDRQIFARSLSTPEDQPVTLETEFHITAGSHQMRFLCEAPGPSVLPRAGRGDQRRLFTTIKDSATGRHPWQYKLTDEEGVPLLPFLIVDFVEIEGPLQSSTPTLAQQRLFPPGPQDLAQVRTTLTQFAERAFRRPVQAHEVDRLVTVYESERQSGEEFQPAMKAALLAILCSKDFLYLVEGSPERTGMQLTEYELASRLSYFLWSTMPDDRLLELARNKTLHQRDVLRGEVARMLRDPRAARFAKSFPRQWLQLRNVGMFPPDKKLYPEYDAHLEQSMIAESTAFFREVLDKNLGLVEFIDSAWTMVDARLAEHYGVGGIESDELQRVALRPEDRRGGLLTQAAVLSLTSDGQRHRPVHRGKWLLETIFNKPPPPPPANVDPIEPTPSGQPKATLRMKLEAHKSDASCAACHRRIDPLGLAFDNYDAIGRWRTEEKVKDGEGVNPAVDASGELPDGRKFTDAAELKRLLVADTEKFASAFVEKLATYALRRTMTIDDRAALSSLVAQSKESGYRLRDIVEGLIVSDLFQHR